MSARFAPSALSRAGMLLLLVGGLALAFAAWGIATLPTPAEEVRQGQEASEDLLERFRLRLDHNARLQGSGLGLLAAGAVLALGRSGTASARAPPLALGGGLVASVVIVTARWKSIGMEQFGGRWDHWVMVEAVAWIVWAAALIAVVLPTTPRPDRAEEPD